MSLSTLHIFNSKKSKCSVTHLEALAAFWALINFKDIILGYSITVYTDYFAVTQLFQSRNLTECLARWSVTVYQFKSTLKYLAGKSHSVANDLSHNIPIDTATEIANFSLIVLRNAQREDPP